MYPPNTTRKAQHPFRSKKVECTFRGNEEPMSWLKGMRENWQRAALPKMARDFFHSKVQRACPCVLMLSLVSCTPCIRCWLIPSSRRSSRRPPNVESARRKVSHSEAMQESACMHASRSTTGATKSARECKSARTWASGTSQLQCPSLLVQPKMCRWSSGGHSVICGDPAMVRHFLKDSFDV